MTTNSFPMCTRHATSLAAVAGTILAGTAALATVAAALLTSVSALAADLSIQVDSIKQTTGTLQLAVYSSEDSFRKQAVREMKLTATEGVMAVKVTDLPPGEYAVMLFQDINGNDKLDSNLLGIPKEPWGGSVQRSVMGAPGWADTRFDLPAAGKALTIRVNH